MFGRIAPWYDVLNHVLTLGIDRTWRRRLARAIASRAPARALAMDVACGTGDVMRELLAADLRVLGGDFCRPMLDRARRKGLTALFQGDALRLPARDGTFDCATVAFGVRNFEEPGAGLREIARTLKTGGTLGVIEFGIPTAPGLRHLYLAYFRLLLPLMGKLISGDARAYRYLADSVMTFPYGGRFADLLSEAGLEPEKPTKLTFGIAYLYLARKPVG